MLVREKQKFDLYQNFPRFRITDREKIYDFYIKTFLDLEPLIEKKYMIFISKLSSK